MSKIRVLSGLDIVKILKLFGFDIQSQKGSHIKLKRITDQGIKQTLIIPNHNEIDTGTLKAIYRQALKYIPEEKLFQHFYSN